MANVFFPADATAGDFTCDNYFRYTKVSGNKSGCFVKSGIARWVYIIRSHCLGANNGSFRSFDLRAILTCFTQPNLFARFRKWLRIQAPNESSLRSFSREITPTVNQNTCVAFSYRAGYRDLKKTFKCLSVP